MAASKSIAPEGLKQKVPEGFLFMVRNRWLLNAFFFGLIWFMAGGMSLRTGIAWILPGAVLGPILFFVGYPIISPLNIYRTPGAAYSDMTDLDARDPIARELVLLMQSVPARRFLIATGIKLSLLLSLVMIVIVAFWSRFLVWNTTDRESIGWVLALTATSAVGTLPIFGTELIHWSFQNWGNRHILIRSTN